MKKLNFLKISIIITTFILVIPFLAACDQTNIDIFTEIKPDSSGIREIDISIKTEYLQKSETILGQSESLYDKILEILQKTLNDYPGAEIKTYEESEYTHFNVSFNFDDVNFLSHISIDNFSENPEGIYYYSELKKNDYFFYTEYFFNDYIDMKIDDTVLNSTGADSDYNRIADLVKADSDILNITYQIKFPVKITEHNADIIGEGNTAIWNLGYGDERNIYIEGKKTKFLTYFLIVVLGIISLFIIFIIIMMIFSSKRRKMQPPNRKPLYTYDNYFKRDRNFDDYD
jgi:hypothetical protein